MSDASVAGYWTRTVLLIVFLPIIVLFDLLPGYFYSSCFKVNLFMGVLIALSYTFVQILTPWFPRFAHDFIDNMNNIIHLMLVIYTIYLLITGQCIF
jgi:hypothetical protein